MDALVNETVQYIIKFAVMVVCAIAGIFVGKKIRKNKNNKMVSEETSK